MLSKYKVNSRYMNPKSNKLSRRKLKAKKLRTKHLKTKKKTKLTTFPKLKNKDTAAAYNLQNGGATGGTVCAPYVHNKDTIQDPKKEVVVLKAVHDSSCLTPPALMKLVTAWNKSTPNPEYKIITKDKTQDEIYEAMITVFKQSNSRLLPEHEWWEQPWVTAHLSQSDIIDIKNQHYSPEAPESWHKNPTEWLSTLDIDAKLNQYEVKYPEFKYYGATPIDFDLKSNTGQCEVNTLCNINLKSLLNQSKPKKYIGVVFNLDKHDEPGSHWIALFVNISKSEINYWDSYGIKPPTEVLDLINKLKTQGTYNGIKFKVNINNKRHQYKNSECGVYSCNFIIQQLEGKSYESVINNIVRDDKMNARRWTYFNK